MCTGMVARQQVCQELVRILCCLVDSRSAVEEILSSGALAHLFRMIAVPDRADSNIWRQGYCGWLNGRALGLTADRSNVAHSDSAMTVLMRLVGSGSDRVLLHIRESSYMARTVRAIQRPQLNMLDRVAQFACIVRLLQVSQVLAGLLSGVCLHHTCTPFYQALPADTVQLLEDFASADGYGLLIQTVLSLESPSGAPIAGSEPCLVCNMQHNEGADGCADWFCPYSASS